MVVPAVLPKPVVPPNPPNPLVPVVEGVVAPKVVVLGVVPKGLAGVVEPNMPPAVDVVGAPNGFCVVDPNTEDDAGCCVVVPKGEGAAVDPNKKFIRHSNQFKNI